MTTNEIVSDKPQFIAINLLERSPLNARRTNSRSGLDELKASILSHGLMQNLVVTQAENGKFLVIAGGRRLSAIQALVEEGRLSNQLEVPCQIVSEQHALEMSLAENTVRLAMHPADQFEAFASLSNKGESASEIAQRFGVDESLVLKRMKLASVAPQLLEEYRNEGMTLECLMAYTVIDDHKRQLKVFKSLPNWEKENPSAIRAALTEKMIEASDKMALFVGLDEYCQAGGKTRKDLFGDEVYFESPMLVHKLAGQKLEAIKAELESEGWAWVEVQSDRNYDAIHRCGRLKPRLVTPPTELIELKNDLESRLESLIDSIDEAGDAEDSPEQQRLESEIERVDEQLAAYVGFEPGHLPLAGCFVSIDSNGEVFIDKGLVKPEHKKLLNKILREPSFDGATKSKSRSGFSESLQRDLAKARLPISQVELATHAEIAFDLLAFQLARGILGNQPVNDCLDIQAITHRPDKEVRDSHAAKALNEAREALPSGWLDYDSEQRQFEEFRKLALTDRMKIFAYCVALTLTARLGRDSNLEPTAYESALSLTEANVANYWRPTADNFLKRCSKEQLLGISREVLGDAWANASTIEKKSVLVTQLDRAFARPEDVTIDPKCMERLRNWLPAGMAFSSHETTLAKPRKSKKAA